MDASCRALAEASIQGKRSRGVAYIYIAYVQYQKQKSILLVANRRLLQ